MALIPGTTYDIFVTTGQAIFIGVTTDPNNPPKPVPGDFNLEVVIGGFNPVITAPGYQGTALLNRFVGHQIWAVHGDYGIVDTGTSNVIQAGDGNVSILGAPGDAMQGGWGNSQFLDAHLGRQQVLAGFAGNETIWGGVGDTIVGSPYSATVTIGGAPGDTILGGLGGLNASPSRIEFIDGSRGSQSIVGGNTGHMTIWGGAGDTITAATGGNVTVGGAAGDTIIGGTGVNQFLDASSGGQSITGGAFHVTIWGGAGDTIHAGSGDVTVGGAPGDTIIGGFGLNQLLEGSSGGQSIIGGGGVNETIWGGVGDTIQGGSGWNETIAGVSGETITGGAANTFFDATSGNESIVAGGGNSTVWGGAQDTVQGMSGGSALIGFAGGNETFWDDGATTGRHDSISTFSQPGGDRVSLNSATDTPSGVAGTAVTDGGGNTTVTFSDGSMLTLIGIGSINNPFFTTH
jgi:hypothetical protein